MFKYDSMSIEIVQNRRDTHEGYRLPLKWRQMGWFKFIYGSTGSDKAAGR
jgi:hypothetical protein